MGTGDVSSESVIEESANFSLECDGISGSIFIEQAMAALLVKLFETFKKKQASYGKGNIAKFGEKGVYIRMNDKMERLYNLVWLDKANPLSDESVDDTYEDLADYALIAMLVRHGIWEKI